MTGHLLPGALRRALDRWLFRLGTPESAPIVLVQRRIYVLPTRTGLMFAAALSVMLITSINYMLSLGYMLTFLVASIGVTSIVHAFRNLLHLRVTPGRTAPVFRGEQAEFRLIVANDRDQRRPALRLRVRGSSTDFELPPGASAEISVSCATSRRGLLPIGRTIIETTWPLGLIRAWSVFVPELSCLVYPAPEKDAPPLPANGADSGDGRALATAGDDDFAGLRAHQQGDSPRHVAWKVLARGGPLLTKQFAATRGSRCLLDWHDLPVTLDDETRLARLTAWALAAERSGQSFALQLPRVSVPAGQGSAHLHRCCRELALHGLPAGGAHG